MTREKLEEVLKALAAVPHRAHKQFPWSISDFATDLAAELDSERRHATRIAAAERAVVDAAFAFEPFVVGADQATVAVGLASALRSAVSRLRDLRVDHTARMQPCNKPHPSVRGAGCSLVDGHFEAHRCTSLEWRWE